MSRMLYLISITVLALSFVKLWQLIGQYYVLPLIEGLKDGEYTPPLPTVNLHPIERYKPLEFKDLLNGNDSITFKTAEHNPNIVHIHARSTVQSVGDVLRDTWGRSTRNEERDEKAGNLIWSMLECKEMLQTSLTGDVSHYIPMSNGFVDSAILAYNEHHNLVIRPDDVWIAILSQLNLYMNAHAEELRDKFVSHMGKETLRIQTLGNRHNFDYSRMAEVFSDMLKERIKDDGFHEAILPTFSTTTDIDRTIASALMMSTLKKYFNYVVTFLCGIPSITILGTPSDYESILSRLSTIDSLELGPEPRAFTLMLRPIIRQFLRASSSSQTPSNLDMDPFWTRICQPTQGQSGPSYLGGWISTFSVWDSHGQWQGIDLELIEKPLTLEEKVEFKELEKRFANPTDRDIFLKPPPFVFEGIRYPVIPLNGVSNGFGDVDVVIEDNGEVFEGVLVAGHVGAVARAMDGVDGDIVDTIQPSPQWFMFVKEKVVTEYI